MGRHYFQFQHDPSAQICDPSLTPIQLMYSGGVLNGFVWQHVATIKGGFKKEFGTQLFISLTTVRTLVH